VSPYFLSVAAIKNIPSLIKKNLILQNTIRKLVGFVYKIPATDFFADSFNDKEINMGIVVSMTLGVVYTSQERKVANISVDF
jgi:hypothetical protein